MNCFPSCGAGRSAAAPDRQAADIAVRVLTVDLIAILLTQKLALPFGGGSQVQISLFIHTTAMIVLAAKGRLVARLEMTTLFLGMVSLAFVGHTMQQLAEDRAFSLPSILLCCAIHSIFCFAVPMQREDYFRLLRNLQAMVLVVCGLVWLCWAIQYAGLGAPNIEFLIPAFLRLENYVYLQPIEWGAALMKPNAFIFPETSSVSQFIGMGFVIEACFFRRLRVLVALVVSLLATFGGTGILLVALCAPLMMPYLNRSAAVGLLIALPFAALVAWQLGVIDNMVARTGEFSESGSSGHQRFIAPIVLMAEAFDGTVGDLLFGMGAGTLTKDENITWTPLSKALWEYGVFFAATWLAFVIRAFFADRRPFVLGWMAFVQYQLLSGALVVPLPPVLAWLVIGGYILADPTSGRASPIDPACRASWVAYPARSAPVGCGTVR